VGGDTAVLDHRRHAPITRYRPSRLAERRQGLAHVYRGGGRKARADVYDADHADSRRGGRFRWLLSTFLAAGIGAIAIGVAIFGSLDLGETQDGLEPLLKRIRERRAPSFPTGVAGDGLKWATPRSDRLQVATGAQSTKHIIHEQIQVKRDNRPFIQIRPYIKIAARLEVVPRSHADVIPPFNPLRLYAAQGQAAQAQGEVAGAETRPDVAIRVVELLGGILPSEDGQELETQEVSELLTRGQDQDEAASAIGAADGASPPGGRYPGWVAGRARADAAQENTTVLAKSAGDSDLVGSDLDRHELRVLRVGRADTLQKVLLRVGAEAWQAKAMAEAARTIFPEASLLPGMEVHVSLVASLARPDRMEPARFSIYGDGHDHKVSVNRNGAGEFVASQSPFDSRLMQAAVDDGDQTQTASLYAGLYNAALAHGLSPETILQILRIHAYETDFRRRVRASDGVEFFFDVKEEAGIDSVPGELLFTSIISGGEAQRFWRFRTPDGVIDYYDEFGQNSRKFLMRRPVRGESVHLVSGFGMRKHPLLNFVRMHTGVDWAGPIGTPIMAGGSGTIEEAKYKGDYGNYVRIRHANGYSTTYGHMSRFAPDVADGAKVRQGQVIGYIGNTGLSGGPHLHYEILVNDRFVDPMSIQVPRERKLTGKGLTDFQKERARIDELMRRTPVVTASK
jgi:murein DD-endopeptidase MepM/ murein hydrolase activator NlpD